MLLEVIRFSYWFPYEECLIPNYRLSQRDLLLWPLSLVFLFCFKGSDFTGVILWECYHELLCFFLMIVVG